MLLLTTPSRHAQSLGTLQAYQHWLSKYYLASLRGEQRQDVFQYLISACVNVIVSVISHEIPEKITMAACRLLVSLSFTIRPHFLSQLPRLQEVLVCSSMGQFQRLPFKVNVMLHQALVGMLILPWPNVSDREQVRNVLFLLLHTILSLSLSFFLPLSLSFSSLVFPLSSPLLPLSPHFSSSYKNWDVRYQELCKVISGLTIDFNRCISSPGFSQDRSLIQEGIVGLCVFAVFDQVLHSKRTAFGFIVFLNGVSDYFQNTLCVYVCVCSPHALYRGGLLHLTHNKHVLHTPGRCVLYYWLVALSYIFVFIFLIFFCS